MNKPVEQPHLATLSAAALNYIYYSDMFWQCDCCKAWLMVGETVVVRVGEWVVIEGKSHHPIQLCKECETHEVRHG